MTEPWTRTRTELAQRSGDGVGVTLVCVDGDGEDEAVVCVCDRREGACFEIAIELYVALDVSCHPFAYRAFAAVHHEHSGLGA